MKVGPVLRLGLPLMVVLAVSSFAASVMSRPGDLPRLGGLPEFHMTAVTAAGAKPVRREDLAGRVWVASFVFTRCGGPCPVTMARLAELQRELPPAIGLLTITVDPEHDTPDVLQSFAVRWHADPARWLFLRGDAAALRTVVYEGFRQSVFANPGGPVSARVVHSSRLALLDASGRVRGVYETQDLPPLEHLRRDLLALARESGPVRP